MVRIRRLVAMSLVLAAGLVAVGSVRAGDGNGNGVFPNEAQQPTDYPPWRIWAPAVARAKDYFKGPKISVYPPDRHPEIAPTYTILKYPCPPADAVETLIQRPSPPADSRFKY